MRPINEKERTVAFIQFLVLFILTVILFSFLVFFDYKVKGKHYTELKEENSKLKSLQLSSSDLPVQIDSLKKIVLNFKTLSETNYEDNRKIFIDELSRKWHSSEGDSSELGKIKMEMLEVFKEWSYGVGSSIRELNKNSSLKDKDLELKLLQDKYDNLKTDFDDYKIAHPPHSN